MTEIIKPEYGLEFCPFPQLPIIQGPSFEAILRLFSSTNECLYFKLGTSHPYNQDQHIEKIKAWDIEPKAKWWPMPIFKIKGLQKIDIKNSNQFELKIHVVVCTRPMQKKYDATIERYNFTTRKGLFVLGDIS